MARQLRPHNFKSSVILSSEPSGKFYQHSMHLLQVSNDEISYVTRLDTTKHCNRHGGIRVLSMTAVRSCFHVLPR
jgi:hypothetical protein